MARIAFWAGARPDPAKMERAAALPPAVANNVLYHTKQLTQRSELLKEEVAHNKVKIVSGVYKLASGKVEWLTGN